MTQVDAVIAVKYQFNQHLGFPKNRTAKKGKSKQARAKKPEKEL